MTKLYFDGLLTLECGGASYIQGASVFVPEDYTMNQAVTAIKEAGYESFRLESMKRLVKIK